MTWTDQDETARRELEAAVLAGSITPISVGPDCTSAAMLQHLGLRKAAYPFDWLSASQGVVEHCLADDFRTLLDPRHHAAAHKRRSDHLYYRDRFGLPTLFHHHRMPEQLPHFLRATQRFRSAAAPVFLYIDAGRWPDPELLSSMRSNLRGPLISYVLLNPGQAPAGEPSAGVTGVALKRPWDLKRLDREAAISGLSARLVQDLAGRLRA